MLDEKDLQAIGQMFAQQRKEIMQDVTTLMDTQFSQRFDLLAENQKIIMEKLERLDDMDVIDTRISALEAMVKKLNRDMSKLKQAN